MNGSKEGTPEELLVRDLSLPRNLPGTPRHVEFEFTHGSVVFMTERDVYKIKRARNYGFFDYTDLDSREHFCHEEVRLNRRTAPDVYLGVLPVFRDGEGYSLVRPGDVVDHAVHMRRLPEDRSALSLLKAGRLGHEEIGALASFVARFYRDAEPTQAIPGALRASIEENFAQLGRLRGAFADEDVLQQVRSLQETWLVKHDELLNARPSCDGHGDLRLEHAYLFDDGPLVIDCIEFLDRFRIGDPALDVAFLAMDLYRHNREDLAESFLGKFAYEIDDYDFYPLVDGYMSYRAVVRGKVACLVAGDSLTPPDRSARKAREAREFFDLAHRVLAGPRETGRLIGVGGIIASGKTTVAHMLASLIGAPIVSADATRKDLASIDKEASGDASLYEPGFTAGVHEELLRRAGRVLESGRSAILDTTFKSRELRSRVRRLATRMKVPFLMIECRVPEQVARERLRKRKSGPSDAREDLLDTFIEGYEPMSELASGEHIELDTTSGPEEMLNRLGQVVEPGWGAENSRPGGN